MSPPLGKSTRRRRNRSRSGGCSYENLEDRRMLATLVSFDSGTGELSISMSGDNEIAVVSISDGNVSVNGDQDVDPSTPGIQPVVFTAIRSIAVNGDNGAMNQQVTLTGDYSNANGGRLQSIAIQNVSTVGIIGEYDLANSFTVSLIGSGGQLGDGTTLGRIRVGGASSFSLGDNFLLLDNSSNNFVGRVDITTGGTDQFALISDTDDIQFGDVSVSGEFVVTAGGNITDSSGSTIHVVDAAIFMADSVVFGDDISDSIRFGQFNSTTLGLTSLDSDADVFLGDIRANNLTIATPNGIFDGRTTNIAVTSVAEFTGGTRIRIGDNGTDTFNAGAINFNSGGYVSIFENSGTELTGSNTALNLDIVSEGDLTDDATAQTNVTNISGFEALNVILGDAATDEFNSGSLYFFTTGDFSVSEDSGLHIIETKNQARRMFLTSTSTITDANDAQVTVELLAGFTAASVNLGDTASDSFNAGSIMFETTGQFRIHENTATNLVGMNSALSSLIESDGSITNVYVGPNSEGTSIEIASVASFTGQGIFLGDEENDSLNFGSIQLVSTGLATLTEDSATHFALASQVAGLNMTSSGAITDALTGSLNVNGIASLAGTSITLGETATDEFNAGSITVDAAGSVAITEDSSLNLHGVNRANAMTLVADGLMTDSLEADTRVLTLLNVTAAFINLGSEATDFLESGELRFNSAGNTNITSDSNMLLSGTSFAGDRLLLTTIGNLNDTATADTQVQNRANLTGVDVIIGELATDCFDILNGGAANLTVNATGIENVVVGC